MPVTNVYTIGRERSVSTLTRKVYGTAPGTEAHRRAEAAVLAANPRLAEAAGFEMGASVVLPSVNGLKPGVADAIGTLDPATLASAPALRLSVAASRLKDAVAVSEAARKEGLARLRDDAFLAEARKDVPKSAALLARATETPEAEERDAEARAARLQSAVSEAGDAISALTGPGLTGFPGGES